MRIFIGLVFLSFIFSCVSPPKTSNVQIQVLTPVENTVEKVGELYMYENTAVFFKLSLQSDSSFNLVKDSYHDCTGSYWCKSNGTYQLKQDSILLNFQKATGGRETEEFIEFFSNRTITLPFSECEIKLLSIELKNESCE
ncbi:hypothetical protein ACE193_24470 [Bernardetia sp. OM2101]|uniref:hypothetical protein n=1 Tax=Bernardetia sp. OM2101 TaxID=3344876 RepID=UPI0035D074BB